MVGKEVAGGTRKHNAWGTTCLTQSTWLHSASEWSAHAMPALSMEVPKREWLVTRVPRPTGWQIAGTSNFDAPQKE